jgi:HlyD family secretion protein
VINAPNPDLKLKPGMTANVTIFIVDKQNVLCVSNKALKFSPRPPFVSPEDVINDCDAKDKLWVREENTFTAKAVTVGSTNGTITEVSGIAEGTVVIEEASFNSDAISAPPFEMQQRNGSSSPFMPGPLPGKR